MKLATFTTHQDPTPRVGVVTGHDSAIVDLAMALSQAGLDPRVAGSMAQENLIQHTKFG
jgi:hypothetical protein